VIPRAIAVGVILFGLGRAVAQLPTDAAAAVALSAEQEKSMAGQARSVTRSAIGTVFGAGQGAAPGAPAAAPGAPAAAPGAPAAAAPLDGAPAAPAAAAAAAGTDGAQVEAAQPAANAAALAARGRDPFRPFTLDLRPETEETAILTPLQRYELPQLRLTAVVLDLKPPRAMLQDNSGMGYIVTPGTPIGRRRGVVKAIESRRVVVEEHVLDYYGREQVHQVVIEMSKDDKPQSAVQE
jgi:type IV pilus assembly protein PilP